MPDSGEYKEQKPVPDGYTEVTVDFIKFEIPGDHVDGRLLFKESVNVRGNRVGKYLLKSEIGQRVSFLGGVHIDDLLRNVPLGENIRLEYTHSEKVAESGNEIKKFRLFVKASNS